LRRGAARSTYVSQSQERESANAVSLGAVSVLLKDLPIAEKTRGCKKTQIVATSSGKGRQQLIFSG